MTNLDKVLQMSVEEFLRQYTGFQQTKKLALFISENMPCSKCKIRTSKDCDVYGCAVVYNEWLQEECDE